MRTTKKALAGIISAAAVATVTLAGCTTAVSDDKAEAGNYTGDEISIVNISGGLGFPYFQSIKSGSEDAARDLNVDYQFVTGPNTTSTEQDFVTVFENAIAQEPDVIILDMFFPDSQTRLAKDAVAKGITVLMQGDGRDAVDEIGALGYVGGDPTRVGETIGQGAADAGVKKGLCVIQTAGNPMLEGYCAGFASGVESNGGTSETLTIPNQDANNDAAVQQDIQAVLTNNPDIDGLYTTSSTAAELGLKAIADAGLDGKVKSLTSDSSPAILAAVKDGRVVMALDQQPYLVGYYAVLAAVQHQRYGFDLAADLLTGPVKVTSDNVDQILEVIDKYPGVRGAA